MKAVLISIRPKWCEKIISGEKTIEVRKTRPKMDTPFRCYIYCTQSADMLWILKERERSLHPDKIADVFKAAKCGGAYRGNGKIIGEFVCYRIDALVRVGYMGSGEMPRYNILNADAHIRPAKELFQRACLTEDEAEDYLKGRYGFGWHISDLKIYDQPKELNEFWLPPELYCEKERCGGCPYDQVADVNGEYSFDCEWKRPLTRPPQSWRYVEEELWND